MDSNLILLNKPPKNKPCPLLETEEELNDAPVKVELPSSIVGLAVSKTKALAELVCCRSRAALGIVDRSGYAEEGI